MKIDDICADVYTEECKRASKDTLEIKDKEVIEIKLSEKIVSELNNREIFEQDTLVGAMSSPRQFGIALKRKFYHIPASFVEEYSIPKYIALYQSQRMFGEEISGVKYYGEVKKCTPMKRSRIREIPKKSNEIYFKFKIKEWKRLDTPIVSKELGFVRLFTSFFLLQNVDEISALTITNGYEFYLYKLLKNADMALNSDTDIACFNIDGFDVIFTKEIIYLCREQKIIERYYRSNVKQTPNRLLQKMKKDITVILEKIEKINKDKEKNN